MVAYSAFFADAEEAVVVALQLARTRMRHRVLSDKYTTFEVGSKQGTALDVMALLLIAQKACGYDVRLYDLFSDKECAAIYCAEREIMELLEWNINIETPFQYLQGDVDVRVDVMVFIAYGKFDDMSMADVAAAIVAVAHDAVYEQSATVQECAIRVAKVLRNAIR